MCALRDRTARPPEYLGCVTAFRTRGSIPCAAMRLSLHEKRRDHFRHAFCLFNCLTNTPLKAVFAFLGDEVENYAHTHDGIQIDEFESATRRYPIYECLYNQEKICLCPAPVGSAAAVQVLEYLIAGGVTKIISVGSCGVLEDIPENRFLIPVSALRDEGTSYHYLPPSREVEISKAGINAIESALSQKNIPYWEVKTWTTDGFYRETVEMVQYRKEEGCQVVEMECSALAACAKFRKVTWAMLLFSADTLADPHKYQEREWGKTSISIALELALDAVLSVVEE